MGEWDAGTYEGKDTILRVVRQEADRFFSLAEPATAWEASTACAKWTTRDVVGHIVDTTEGYFDAFDAAHGKADAGPVYGLPAMSERANAQATAFRDQSQQAMLTRLREDFQKMMAILEPLNADEWTGFMVQHAYMGPLPASFYAAGQLMDYGVHSWDIRQGSERGHVLSGDAADLLVPYMFVLWQYTIRADADLTPFDIGIRITSGHSSGDYRVSIGPDGMSYEKGNVDDLPAVIEFDAGSMVLTTFGRVNAGAVRGDYTLADRFLNLFFRI
jgi:uncharacterized protein (TIGR03083 family)